MNKQTNKARSRARVRARASLAMHILGDYLENKTEEDISVILEAILPEYVKEIYGCVVVALDILRSVEENLLYEDYGYESIGDYCIDYFGCSMQLFLKAEELLNAIPPEELPEICINMSEVY